jgi:hypothetical protein
VAADRRARMPAVRESMVGSCLCRRFLDFALLLSASRRQSSSSTSLAFQRVDDAASDRKMVGGQTGLLHIVVFGRGERREHGKVHVRRVCPRLTGSRTEDNRTRRFRHRERVKGETDCNRMKRLHREAPLDKVRYGRGLKETKGLIPLSNRILVTSIIALRLSPLWLSSHTDLCSS